MKFGTDVFISYAHQDDQAVPGEIGWVSQFEANLKAYLAKSYRREPRLWRDRRLRGNQDFDEEIQEQLLNSAVLVCILSPRYVDSLYCKMEREEFLKASGESDRLFKVVTFGLPDHQEHPDPLNRQNGYLFFSADPQTGDVYELNPDDDGKSTYRRLIQDLARHISEQLTELEGKPPPKPVPREQPSGGDRGVIYLAQTSFDLKEERESVQRDLELHGYSILPNQPLPTASSDCQDFVREQLALCNLSVHLIGQYSGGIPDGPDRSSYTELQNKLAIERGPEGLSHITWLPPGLEIQDEEHGRFVDRLRAAPSTYEHGDLYQTSFEELKAEVLLKAQLPAASEQPGEQTAGTVPKRIYLICDQQDLDRLAALEDSLFDSGYEVVPSIFEDSDPEIVREYHAENLQSSDAVMIYYGHGVESWLRQKMLELRRCPAGTFKAIYVAPPDSPAKARLRTREATLIVQGEQFDPKILDPFLARIQGNSVSESQ